MPAAAPLPARTVAALPMPLPNLRRPRALRGSRRACWAMIPALLGGLLLVHPGAMAAERLDVSLQCRLGQGPWQPCRMQVQDVGLRWELLIGGQRIGFRHGGDGAVHMRRSTGLWQPVEARWQADASLCWDGVCARGAIPLD